MHCSTTVYSFTISAAPAECIPINLVISWLPRVRRRGVSVGFAPGAELLSHSISINHKTAVVEAWTRLIART